MGWINRKPEDWIGKTIVSQYGLVCSVTAADGEKLTCLDRYKNKTWEWNADKISLVTRAGELLDSDGTIYGKMVDGHWRLYADEECRIIEQAAIDDEFVR